MAAIGVSTPRRDSEPKVRGQTRFAADLPVPGLLHARLVLSHEAHALIRAIDTEAAAHTPGVVAVLTARELPLKGSGSGRIYEPLARTEVLYAGQPVALVVAESEAAAEDGAELVEVDLELLPPVLDLDAATRPGSPLAQTRADTEAPTDALRPHGRPRVGRRQEIDATYSDNVRATASLPHGDTDAELAASDVTVRARFTTPWVYQGYLEPQAATAWPQPDGELVVSAATQAPFATRDALAQLFGLPTERVRIRATTLGGAFGGKMMIVDTLAAAAALAVRRPVRLAMTRGEDQSATNPAGAQIIDLEAGATADGTLTAVRASVLVDRGSTEDYGVESIAAMLTAGPYRWRAHDVRALGVATNRVTFGAYRAPTAPPAAFALESLIDELADRLSLDPLEFRLRNVASEGDRTPSGRPFGVFGAKACLERVQDHPLYASRHALPDGEGVGLALGWWPGGYEPAAAVCRLDAAGTSR